MDIFDRVQGRSRDYLIFVWVRISSELAAGSRIPSRREPRIEHTRKPAIWIGAPSLEMITDYAEVNDEEHWIVFGCA